jgi:hypothetical protein
VSLAVRFDDHDLPPNDSNELCLMKRGKNVATELDEVSLGSGIAFEGMRSRKNTLDFLIRDGRIG